MSEYTIDDLLIKINELDKRIIVLDNHNSNLENQVDNLEEKLIDKVIDLEYQIDNLKDEIRDLDHKIFILL